MHCNVPLFPGRPRAAPAISHVGSLAVADCVHQTFAGDALRGCPPGGVAPLKSTELKLSKSHGRRENGTSECTMPRHGM